MCLYLCLPTSPPWLPCQMLDLCLFVDLFVFFHMTLFDRHSHVFVFGVYLYLYLYIWCIKSISGQAFSCIQSYPLIEEALSYWQSVFHRTICICICTSSCICIFTVLVFIFALLLVFVFSKHSFAHVRFPLEIEVSIICLYSYLTLYAWLYLHLYFTCICVCILLHTIPSLDRRRGIEVLTMWP